MLPPAYNATGVKSQYITADNLDDFALSIRDTADWEQYKLHPAFQDPLHVTLEHLKIYEDSQAKTQQPRDRRERAGQGHGRQQGRDANRKHGDRQHSSDSRKRRWDDVETDPTSGPASRGEIADVPPRRYPPPKRHRQISPEPGEVSDAGSAAGATGYQRSHDIRGLPKRPPPVIDVTERIFEPPRSPGPRDQGWGPREARDSYRPTPQHGKRDADYQHRTPDERDRDYRAHSHTSREHPREHGDYDRHYDTPGRRWSRGGRSRSPAAHRHYPQRSHSPMARAIRAEDLRPGGPVSYISSRGHHTPDGESARGRRGEIGPPPLPPPRTPPGRRSSRSSRGSRPGSRAGSKAGSRRSSFGHLSAPESAGSPLTALEAELLGIGGNDSSDSDADKKSPKRRPRTNPPTKLKRRQPRVDAYR